MADNEVDKNVNLVLNFNITGNECNFSDLTAAYRILRNYCASGRHAQNALSSYTNLLSKTKSIVLFLLEERKENQDLCLLVSLQFIANYLVDNKANQEAVWLLFAEILQNALKYGEGKIQNCAAMIIYNVLLDNDVLLLQIDDPLIDIICLTESDLTSEYAEFILELFVCKTMYVCKHLRNLDGKSRAVVLRTIETVQKNPEERRFPDGMVKFLAGYFIDTSHAVLQVSGQAMEAGDAQEVSMVLDLVNSISSSDSNYLLEIQSVEELLIHAIGLLKTVHALSKEKGNQFSMLLKLADVEAVERDEAIHDHPAFGFKAALVRLIGNMCWRNKRHQDTSREMGAIPLILDCSNIDARNPLIIQYVVLAMRNLCENNAENQRVVASVDRRGQVDSARLAELGILFNGSHKK